MALGEADLGDTGRWMGMAPSGNSVLLAEIGAGWSGAGMVNTAPQAISAWMCGESSDRLMTLGGATLNDDRLDLLLYNPYVLDSLVQVLITSELGEDTPPALREIYVPAGKTVKMSLDEPLRLRRSLAVQADSSPGRIALLLQQTGNGETAMIEGMVPHTEWWLPIPDLGQAEARLLIASPSGSPFTYRLDLMTEDGPLLGFLEEEYLPDQLVSMSLADFPKGVTGIGVSGTVPLVAGFAAGGGGTAGHRSGSAGDLRAMVLAGRRLQRRKREPGLAAQSLGTGDKGVDLGGQLFVPGDHPPRIGALLRPGTPLRPGQAERVGGGHPRLSGRRPRGDRGGDDLAVGG